MEQERKKRALRVVLIGLAVCLAGGLLLIAQPPCLILKETGFYCGACGFTRMVQALLQGDIAGGFRENPYLFVVVPLAAVWLAGEGAQYIRGGKPLWNRKWMMVAFGVVLAAGIVFTVLRNLPGFETLRPR